MYVKQGIRHTTEINIFAAMQLFPSNGLKDNLKVELQRERQSRCGWSSRFNVSSGDDYLSAMIILTDAHICAINAA